MPTENQTFSLKYTLACSNTFGASIKVEIMVGIDIKAKDPEIKLSTASRDEIAAITIVATKMIR